MPTKVASYLTELGFKQIEDATLATNYNRETAGEYLVIKGLGRMYRYDDNSTEAINGITVLGTSDGGDTRWLSVGGSSMKQESITGSFNEEGNTITLNRAIASPYEILYVNVGNTQILRSEYANSIVIGETTTTITLPNTIPAGTGYEVMIFSGNTYIGTDIDYSILPATLYQHMMTVSGNNIELNNDFSIYAKTVSAATTLNFTMPSSYISSLGVITFELYINMTTASTILWTPTISWNGGTAPLFNDVKKYLLSFRTFDGGNTWIGNLEMTW